MKIFLFVLINLINCSVREVLKNSSNMMHHKLVKDYAQRMTRLMMKQSEKYPCDRYLQDSEIDYTRQINVHYKNPVYGVIQLDNGKKFVMLNHAFNVNQSQKEIINKMSFKPSLFQRFQEREPINTQMQCMIYVKLYKRNFIYQTMSLLIQVDFYSNCKDQKTTKFFELKGGSMYLNQFSIKSKEFKLEVQYMGNTRSGIVFNTHSTFYQNYQIFQQNYRPKHLKDDFRWRWIRAKKRRRRRRRTRQLDQQVDSQIDKLLQNQTNEQKKTSDLQEKEFQQQIDKELKKKLVVGNKKKQKQDRKLRRRRKSSRRNKSNYNRNRYQQQRHQNYNRRQSNAQMKDVEKSFEMLIPKKKSQQFFDYGVVELIWNKQNLINCTSGYRKLKQNQVKNLTKRKLFYRKYNPWQKHFNNFANQMSGKMICTI